MSNEVIILAGQSNMIGMNWKDANGNVYPSYFPMTYQNPSRIWMKPQFWNGSFPYEAARPGGGPFVQASDPLHINPNCGVGPGMAMADQYIVLKNDPNLNVGLVPCAQGGSKLDWDWIRFPGYSNAYGNMVGRSIAAKSWGTLKCLVIYLGESDAGVTPGIFPQWIESLYDLILKFRAAVGVPDLRVIVTKLGINPGLPYWDGINNQLETMAGVDPTIALVRPSWTGYVDGVHLAVPGTVTLGAQYAQALVAM